MDTTVQSVAKAVWWLVLLRGIFMILFGIIALVSRGIALLTLVWLVGIFILAGGIALIILAFRVRSVARSTDSALGAR